MQDQTNTRGYTLIELMIVIVIIGILASVILPMYREHILEARRSEARAAIEEVRNLEYEFFQNNKRYGSLSEIEYPALTPGDHYQLAVNAGALRFSVTATANNDQQDDIDCRIFTLSSVDTLLSYDSGGSQNTNCW